MNSMTGFNDQLHMTAENLQLSTDNYNRKNIVG